MATATDATASPLTMAEYLRTSYRPERSLWQGG